MAEPLLGVVTAPYEAGWGTVRPRHVYNGGDPLGNVTHIVWHSYGGQTARGSGIGWVSGKHSVAEGHTEPVEIVGYDPGTCFGHRVYLNVTWYAPALGESFHRNTSSDNMCSEAHDWLHYVGIYYPGVFDGEDRCPSQPPRPGWTTPRHLLVSSSVGCTTAALVAMNVDNGREPPAGWACKREGANVLCAQAPPGVVRSAGPHRAASRFLRSAHVRLVQISGGSSRF